MTHQTCVHLVDDTNAGGVMRVLHYLRSLSLSQSIQHRIEPVRRGRLVPPPLRAEVIVSHLSISWQNLPLLVALRGLYPDVPLVHMEHSYCAGFVAANTVPRTRFYALLRACYCLFDRVVAVSEGQANWLIRRDLADASKMEVIRPCVDLKPFLNLAAKPSLLPSSIALMGRLHRQKGFDLAIEAFRQSAGPKMKLEIFGDGPERATLQAVAGNDPRIRFNGHCHNPANALARCEVVAMPSRWEPFGLVGLEAQAAGRSLLCSSVDGLADQRAGAAILVSGHSVDRWAEAFANLPVADRERRAIVGRNYARSQARRFEHDWRHLIETLAFGGKPQHPEPAHIAGAA